MENKEKIKKFVDEKYKGSLRFLKPKMFSDYFGVPLYQEILNNTSFLSESSPWSLRVYCYLKDITHSPTCKVCNELVRFNSNKGYPKYCSNKCRISDMSSIHEKVKSTNIQKYGTYNFLASSQGKQKITESNLKKYGVSNYTQTEEYKSRIRNKDIIRKSNGPKVKEVLLKKHFDSLNTKYPSLIPLFSFENYQGAHSYDISYPWKCKVCDTEFIHWINNNYPILCPTCKPKGTYFENKLKSFFEKHKIKYIYRDRQKLSSLEIDFFLPEYQIGIEINGLYWHSEKNTSNKNYHLNKTQLAENNHIRLIQVFEDELYKTPQIVFTRLKHLLGLTPYKIFARKCEVRSISSQQKRTFVEKYHIQGDVNTSFNYGLFYKNRLVAVMSFNSLRRSVGKKTENNKYELVRYCSLSNFSVLGGASKLFCYFIKDKTPLSVLSYADRRWSNGEVYSKLGFEFKGYTPINYWYTKNYKTRLHRFGFQKHLLKDKLENYQSELSEKENMSNNGYTRIWDCGHSRWIWAKENL